MRLIDADALKMMYEFRGEGIERGYRAAIDEAPTIEAEPVRHGRWVKMQGFDACSECGASPADWEAKPDNPLGLPPYCHSCGAKMDAKEDAACD